MKDSGGWTLGSILGISDQLHFQQMQHYIHINASMIHNHMLNLTFKYFQSHLLFVFAVFLFCLHYWNKVKSVSSGWDLAQDISRWPHPSNSHRAPCRAAGHFCLLLTQQQPSMANQAVNQTDKRKKWIHYSANLCSTEINSAVELTEFYSTSSHRAKNEWKTITFEPQLI